MENVTIYKRLPNILAPALAVSEITNFMFVYLKKIVKVKEYIFRIDTIPWQMKKSTKDFHTISLKLLPFQIVKLKQFYLQEVVQGHVVEFSE